MATPFDHVLKLLYDQKQRIQAAIDALEGVSEPQPRSAAALPPLRSPRRCA